MQGMTPTVKTPFAKSASTMSEAEAALIEWGVPYTTQPDGTLVVWEDIRIIGKGLPRLPDLTAVIVKGSFFCGDNQLTSLKGAPRHVGGDFTCEHNLLTSLEGAPSHIGHSFKCDYNRLRSLKGAPATIPGYFSCSHNMLTSLDGSPQNTGDSFWCDDNNLVTLNGGPSSVGGAFQCANNKLTSLEGAPDVVGKHFICRNNHLAHLEGVPRSTWIDTDLGDFRNYADIPEELLYSEQTRARMAAEKERTFVEQATILQNDMPVSRPVKIVKKAPQKSPNQ